MTKKRKLSPEFITDLETGVLKELLELIKNDYSLDMQIREDYINIYYRGGNILEVRADIKELYGYCFKFDKNYLTLKKSGYHHLKHNPNLKNDLDSYRYNRDWLKYFALAKQAMDLYLTTVKQSDERENQQLLVRENNYSAVANATDYFVVDIEYANRAGGRFDIIAIEWLSESSKRKLFKSYKPKLVIIEMKYGDKALSGSSGMEKHYYDFKNYFSDPVLAKSFKEEMLELFEQKRRLGLIPCLSANANKNKVEGFNDEIDFAFLISNVDPDSTKLKREIQNLKNNEIKFFASNFLGYGLFKPRFYELTEFLKQIP